MLLIRLDIVGKRSDYLSLFLDDSRELLTEYSQYRMCIAIYSEFEQGEDLDAYIVFRVDPRRLWSLRPHPSAIPVQ